MPAPLRNTDHASLDMADRRRDARAPGGVETSVLMAGKPAAPALLTEVSRYGCCLQTSADWLRPGRFVAIALPDAAPLESIVRWVRGDLAGLELLRPLPHDRQDWLAIID